MDFEECARAVLPPHISAYYAAAAGSGVGLDEGTADWSAVRFRPRVLRDVGTASVSMTILGTSVRSCAASCIGGSSSKTPHGVAGSLSATLGSAVAMYTGMWSSTRDNSVP